MLRSKNKGFTLVEVLVAVGALSVASFAFLPSFTNSLREKNLQQSLEAAKDAAVTARNRALTETGSPGETDTEKYKYSGVRFVRDSGEYEAFRSISADSATCANLPADSVAIDSVKILPGGVVARLAAGDNPTCVFFEYKTGNSVTTKGSSDAVSCTN